MGDVKIMLDGKLIAEATSMSLEYMKEVCSIGAPKQEDKVSYVEACELISKYLKEVHQVEMTGEQVFNASPTGELFHVFQWYHVAKGFYDAVDKITKEREGDKQ